MRFELAGVAAAEHCRRLRLLAVAAARVAVPTGGRQRLGVLVGRRVAGRQHRFRAFRFGGNRRWNDRRSDRQRSCKSVNEALHIDSGPDT